jgi:hypothetical protein
MTFSAENLLFLLFKESVTMLLPFGDDNYSEFKIFELQDDERELLIENDNDDTGVGADIDEHFDFATSLNDSITNSFSNRIEINGRRIHKNSI